MSGILMARRIQVIHPLRTAPSPGTNSDVGCALRTVGFDERQLGAQGAPYDEYGKGDCDGFA
jgi:hypothetical protein